jgi:hypothetical protein
LSKGKKGGTLGAGYSITFDEIDPKSVSKIHEIKKLYNFELDYLKGGT